MFTLERMAGIELRTRSSSLEYGIRSRCTAKSVLTLEYLERPSSIFFLGLGSLAPLALSYTDRQEQHP